MKNIVGMYLEDVHKFVGAEVGLPVHENPRRRSVLDQLLQHPPHLGAVFACPCGELSVAPGPGAALAVAQVGLGVQDAAVDQRSDRATALLHRLPTL